MDTLPAPEYMSLEQAREEVLIAAFFLESIGDKPLIDFRTEPPTILAPSALHTSQVLRLLYQRGKGFA